MYSYGCGVQEKMAASRLDDLRFHFVIFLFFILLPSSWKKEMLFFSFFRLMSASVTDKKSMIWFPFHTL